MKKRFALIGFVLFSCLVFVFYHKNYLDYKLVYEGFNLKENFEPNAYEFFHSKEEIISFFKRNKETRKIENNCGNIKFDFENYSYCIFFGGRVKQMYYSYKTTLCNDISPSYARPSGKKVVFVEYEGNKKNTVFIYRIKKDNSLRGFYGG